MVVNIYNYCFKSVLSYSLVNPDLMHAHERWRAEVGRLQLKIKTGDTVYKHVLFFCHVRSFGQQAIE